MFKQYEFVNPATMYKCPLCQKWYDDYDTANICIKSHSAPETIIGYDDINTVFNCPDIIYVKLSDGRECKYTLVHINNETEKESGENE